jgi:putative nucleotidyltransferase with HDIG domain
VIAEMGTAARREQMVAKIDQLASIPSVEAILAPLVGYLQQPLESLDLQRVVDLISHDNSLAAQCLHMANSPLFGRWQTITTTRGAVIALGLQRMRDIAVSCCVLKLLPGGWDDKNPVVFWEHSLASALVARRVAKRVGMKDPEQAYLAGLLHDLGFVVNMQVAPKGLMEAVNMARTTGCTVEDAEEKVLGITHCDSGRILADKWRLAPYIVDAIKYHHRFSQLSDYLPAVALVNISDRLCRMHGLGYGYREAVKIDWGKDEAIEIISQAWPVARSVNWQSLSGELDSYLKDVQKLVSVLYRFNQ